MTAAVAATAADMVPHTEDKVLVETAITNSSEVIALATIQGRFITLQNTGAEDLYFLFGNSSVVASATATTGVTRSLRLGSGESRDYRFESGASYQDTNGVGQSITHIAVITPTAATTDVRIAQS